MLLLSSEANKEKLLVNNEKMHDVKQILSYPLT